MAIERRYSQEYYNGSIKCFEFDEWAEQPSDQYYQIDCSLTSPTKEATPVPDWIIYEGLYWKFRHETFLYYNAIALAAGYNTLDDYLNVYPQYWFLDQASEEARSQRVIDEMPNIVDREAFVSWYKSQQPDIYEF